MRGTAFRRFCRPGLPRALLAVLVLGGCSDAGDRAAAVLDKELASLAEQGRPEILVTGAAISGANGLQFGPDGLLYVASVIGSELVVLNPETGEVLSRLTQADGVVGPDDLDFGPDGSLFWTSILTGEVAGFDADGHRVVAAQLSAGVNPITFSSDGRLFVAQCFFGDGLFEVDPRGIAAPRQIADDLGPGCGLNGMDWGPDGRLYGPRWFHGEVVSFDVDSGERRTEATGFEVPAAVKFDARGRLHVLDTATGQVLRIDGDQRIEVARLESGLDNFAFDASDRLFVSSFTDGFVVRLEDDGAPTALLPGGMAHPGGVTLLPAAAGSDAAPTVVVADLHALRGFDANTGAPTFTVRNILGIGAMGAVLAVAEDAGNLILTSFTDNSVRLWDPQAGRVLARYDDLALPVSAIRYGGEVVIAEHGSGRVISMQAGTARVLAEGLPAPTGLATDEQRLYVSDRVRGEILEIARDGQPVAPRVVAAGLEAPEGLALLGDDLIVVEGESGRVLRVAGDQVTLVALVAPGTPPASPAQPPSMVFNGVAVWGEVLYVTGEINRVLYRIDLGATGRRGKPAR